MAKKETNNQAAGKEAASKKSNEVPAEAGRGSTGRDGARVGGVRAASRGTE
ncbi:MAG: hypothetical protein JWO56_2780 [Acidobacteria bacterium]|nr:hypothetical protein [Acidobacteriota bacterium]